MTDAGKTQARCRHFGLCGGCRFQDIPYPRQLEEKYLFCRRLLEKIAPPGVLAPVSPSPEIFFHRNKMEFSFGEDEKGALVCGLHRRNAGRAVFDLEECPIFSPEAGALVRAIRDFARAAGGASWSWRKKEGVWRNLVIRETKFTGQTLVNLVTASGASVDEQSLRAAVFGVIRSGREISILHTVNDSPSDAVIPGRTRLLAGTGRLEEKIAGVVIAYGAFAFAQVNPGALSVFYRQLRENPILAGGGKILDIFCGSGGLGIVLAGPGGEITGIELDPAAVESARENSLRNGIRNTLYLAGKARRILRENLGAWKGKFDLAAVNPPRSGLSPRVLERILEIAPRMIVYSSCNPKTFAAEAGEISRDYRLIHARPFDFFPHTPHLELLALFERRNPGAAAERQSKKEAGE